jgi:hypothetical protein
LCALGRGAMVMTCATNDLFFTPTSIYYLFAVINELQTGNSSPVRQGEIIARRGLVSESAGSARMFDSVFEASCCPHGMGVTMSCRVTCQARSGARALHFAFMSTRMRGKRVTDGTA